jgi:glycosyltransferase involved in cell wall biosynthesis/ADP-heptose:LPS heptosyltransferase/predicted SAM-dependent methyltransferase/MoaA/NifB/PqqE/SkfB family radical SAM enzyme
MESTNLTSENYIPRDNIGVLSWEKVLRMPVVRLYAGDVPNEKEYEGLIGLSLTKNDESHIRHDITQPFPLENDSIDSFQAEDVLEHISCEKLTSVINEIYRILKPGGSFRLSVPDYGYDILQNRSAKDGNGQIVFDPGGGGTPDNPGHVWFPRIDTVMQVLTKTDFYTSGRIEPLHYYNKDGTFVAKPIDYSKGHIKRTPDFDERVKNPYRPMSLVVDLTKAKESTVGLKSIKSAPRMDQNEEPKFSFVMIVLNGMPFVKYSLKSVYEFAHEIIIVEGAVEKCLFAANADGSSTDGTVEFIESFPDPQNKIRLIQGKWPEKCEMQNEALKYVTGNYVWLIDSDEVYKHDDLLKIKKIVTDDKSITQVNFIPDSFWKGMDYIFVSHEFFKDWCHFRRLFRYVPGAIFTTHRPPTMVWPGSEKTTEQMNLLDGTKTREMGIVFYHYSYVLDKQVKQKIELYHRYGWGKNWNIDLREWYEECFLKWTPENRQEIDSKYPIWTGDKDSRTQVFRGTHPEVMRDFSNELRATMMTSSAGKPSQNTAVKPESNKSDPLRRFLKRPQYLKIETTNICNANCAFCMYRFMKRKKGTMSMELFRKVVDDYIAAGGGALTISPLVGDCLVDARLLERLRYCRSFNEITHIGFHTNMIGLNRWTDEQILEILDLIDVWNCSIGPNREVYKDMFGVDRFESIIDNLERFLRLTDLIKYKPLVQLNGRASGDMFKIDERLRKLSLALTGKEMKWTTSYMDWGGLLPELPRNTKIVKTTGHANKQTPCMKAVVSSVVFCDGRVGFCGCADHDGVLTIGNASKEKLTEILAGHKRQKMMSDFGKPWLNEYCQKCSFYEPLDLQKLAKWAPYTNPHHPEPIRPSLQRGIKSFSKTDEDNISKPESANADSSVINNEKIITARTLLDRGHITQAIKKFDDVLVVSPDSTDAHFGRAVCLARLGRLLEAEVETKNALSKAPRNSWLQQFSEQICRLKPNLTGDRDLERGFMKSQIDKMAGMQRRDRKLLDFGCGQTAQLTRSIAGFGFKITAVDMMPLTVSLNDTEDIDFIQGNFLSQNWKPRDFDLIINCSSIEHAGLVGRYGVVEESPDEDIRIMARMREIIKPDGKMLLTIPVGLDRVVGSLHRVYGENRLERLLDGWEIESCSFWIKDEKNEWRQVDRESALQREPMLAYGLGCFILRPSVQVTSPAKKALPPLHTHKPKTPRYDRAKTNCDVIDPKKCMRIAPRGPDKVLIIKTDGIGDFVIFSGAIHYYRELYPGSKISIIVRECSRELAETCPYFDEVIVNHRQPMVYDPDYAAAFIKNIQAAKFDVAVCPIYSRDKVSDFVTANSGAIERIASTGNDSNMPLEQIHANDPFFTKLIPAKDVTMRESDRNIEFLEGLGCTITQPYETTVWIEHQDKETADGLLKELMIERPIVACPFAQYPYKDWVLQKWAQLLSSYKHYPVTICGTAEDSQRAEELISLTTHKNIHNMCGKTNLRQLAVILSGATLHFGVDSAPAHIAAAVDCPQVIITGGGHFGRFFPDSPKTTLVYNTTDCYGCNWRCKHGQDIRCINTITCDMVKKAGDVLLKQITEPLLQEQQRGHKQTKDKYLVSAIISTYNSEKFIRGCLEDLENQTIADKLEIIVVNSGSRQNEEAVVRDFQSRYDNIKYIKTEERETIYKAWNRAIKAASGKYITNANTDDRHRADALETMAKTLDENPDKALVYANQLEVDEIDGQEVPVGERINGEFSRVRLFDGECFPGSQPMWRRDVHDSFGYFDEVFTIGGDFEFWFRLTQEFDFIYLDKILGERYVGSEAFTIRDTSPARVWEELVLRKCHEYAFREAIAIGSTGISEHPVFSDWPEVNIWKENTKARLEDKQLSLRDNIKSKWDFRKGTSPKISIIIVTYNRQKDLLENLRALDEQSEKDFEVIVLDNGGDLSWLRDHISEFEFGLLGVELEYNFGPSPARNIGTEFAEGRYLIFLDDDAVADSNLVRNILHHFENKEVSGLRGRVLPKKQIDPKDLPASYDLGDQAIVTACEVSCLSAFRKDVLIETGGFDDLLFGSEGLELSYRICKSRPEKMKSILYFPDVIVYHNPPAKGPALTERIIRYERMELLAWRKDNCLTGYKEHIQSLYPGNKDVYKDMYHNYSWMINIVIYLSNMFPEEAIKWAEKAVALAPARFKGCYILGSLYAGSGRFDEALPLLEKIYEPLRNSILNRKNEFISPEFDENVDISECYVKTCTLLAQCYIEKKQYEKVKQAYTELLNNQNLILTNEQKTDISNVLRSLDRTISAAKPQNAVTASAEPQGDYLVSAIVSTYNSERFLRGCLEDLEKQTIADKVEIIVINSGSQEKEEEIVREYQQKYANIVYVRTEHREGIYAAWNRAVKVARGTFITNANTDDRHRDDALEIMATTLIANPDIALVYGDQVCTDTPNCTFADHHAVSIAKRPEFSFERLLYGCCVGSQPMWRRKLHDEFGYFDETLSCAGDWDFWLRISSKYEFRHIPEFLGLYYRNEEGIEHGRKIHSLYERYMVGKRYGNPYISVIPRYESPDNPLISIITPAYNAAQFIAETIESVLIQNYRNFEMIIVDDGSTDNTKDMVTNFKDERIRYIYKENSGPAGARNLALCKSNGRYIVPLDADDMITPDFIARHLQEFEKNPEADLIYCDDLLINENSRPIRTIQRPPYTDLRLLIRDLFHNGFPIIPFRTCFKRSVIDEIGFFDEELLVGEDYDMIRRFIRDGLKMHHLKDALYLRRMTSDSLSKSYSIEKAKCHFEVIRRFTETFRYDELFPDVDWEQIAPQMRDLHAKCLTAGTYLGIGHEYVKSNAPEYSKTAFENAYSELDECMKIDPENEELRRLFQKTQLIRNRYGGQLSRAALK